MKYEAVTSQKENAPMRGRKRLVGLAAFGLAVSFLTCRNRIRDGAGDALVDAGEWIRDGGSSDANADTEEGSRVLTADSDLSRMEAGSAVLAYDSVALVSGPFIVTELVTGESPKFWIVSSGDCGDAPPASWEAGGDMIVTGARIPLREGEQLCAQVTENYQLGKGVLWSGFRPYDG